MSSVSVSRDALHKVKTAFRDFQTSVEASTDHMKAHAEDVIASTRASIKKQQAVVESLKNKVTSLSADIEQCQAQIISNNNQVNSLKGGIADASSRVSAFGNQIAQLNAQKQRLLSQNSSNGDSGNDNSAQNRTIENQIQSYERQRRQLSEQISSMRSQESSLNTQNAKLRDDKARLDTALATAKGELVKAGEKSERMKSAGTAVESSVSSFLGVAQQFRQTAVTTSSTGTSGIEKCLAAIDEYETVNLGAGAGSMNTDDELVQIAEMEASGEFDISAVELLNSTRGRRGSVLTQNPMVFDLPANTQRYSMDDFATQVLMQEDGLNLLTVGEFLSNYEHRADYGRDSGGNTQQTRYRMNLVELIMEDILAESPDTPPTDARAEAEECASILAALHNPDQIAGGSGFGVTGAGSRSVNSALGSLWRHGRARELYEQVREASAGMSEDAMNNTRLNVTLHVHERN